MKVESGIGTGKSSPNYSIRENVELKIKDRNNKNGDIVQSKMGIESPDSITFYSQKSSLISENNITNLYTGGKGIENQQTLKVVHKKP